jgi:hypothetical protein
MPTPPPPPQESFSAALAKADDVDELIAAHESYLNKVTTLCLLNDDERARIVRSALSRTFSAAEAYVGALEALVAFAEGHAAERRRVAREERSREAKGEWGVGQDAREEFERKWPQRDVARAKEGGEGFKEALATLRRELKDSTLAVLLTWGGGGERNYFILNF